MKTLHAKRSKKSLCCQALIRRFGSKRRQCASCLKTWRVRPKKRGPKPKRLNQTYLKRVLQRGLAVKNLSRQDLTVNAVYKRFGAVLNYYIANPRVIPATLGAITIIIDAQWHNFKREHWTLYIIAIKSTNSEVAFILDPVLIPGKESALSWLAVINRTLPERVKQQVKSMVSDGIRGIENVARYHGWILQRCHFHLLATIQKRRGKRVSTLGRAVRENIYQTVRELLLTNQKAVVQKLKRQLRKDSCNEFCPKPLKMIVNEFLRRLDCYHVYLNYPELKIPKTTNVIESVNSKIKSRAGKIKTPKALLKWATAIIRSHQFFRCK